MKKFFIGVAAVVTVGALVLAGCPEDGSSVVDLSYVCENGTAADGNGATAGISNCTECSDGYLVMGIAGTEESTCVATTFPYVCENGFASTATTDRPDVSNCIGCESSYLLTGDSGAEGTTCTFTNLYICENGVAATTTVPVATDDVSNCISCIENYSVMGVPGAVGSTCIQTAFPYICEDGTVAPGTAATAGVSNCAECIDDYDIVGTAGTAGSTCIQSAFPYVCTNGIPFDGSATSADTSNCAQCNVGSVPGTIALSTEGSTCTVFSGCRAPATGTTASVSTIYADGNYAGCSAAALAATNSIGALSSNSMATFTQITSGGASSTTNAYTFNNPTAAATSGSGFITLAADTNVSSKKVLRFSVMSPETNGTSMVRVYLQADPGASTLDATYQTETTEGIVTLTNDGTWQDVSISLDDTYSFTGTNITAATVRTIGFAIVEDTNGGTTVGLGEQTFSVDEVRIEDNAPNCNTGSPTVVDLVWGDAAYSSCDKIDAAISGSFYTAVHVPTRNPQSRPPSPFTVATSSLAGGASSTPLFIDLTLGNGNSVYAHAMANLPSVYDATGKTLKFSVKSPVTGGTGSIGIFLGDANSQTSTSIQAFTNDGIWQEISVPVNSFIFPGGGVSVSTVQRIGFSLVDTNGLSIDGLGTQTLAIDEIRFE